MQALADLPDDDGFGPLAPPACAAAGPAVLRGARPSRLRRRALLGGMLLGAAGLAGRLVIAGDDPASDLVAPDGVSPIPAETIPTDHAAIAAPALSSADRPPPAPLTAEDHAEWAAFRSRFITADGRVVDTGNHGNSHSEGQGWGMFFAATFGDRDTFDRLLGWTQRTLRRPDDALHAWRFRPGEADPVADPNNATDGDLFIAGALARAAIRWGRPEDRQAATAIARDILRLLVRDAGGRAVLLPGVDGFVRDDRLVINPSYYAFALFPELDALTPSPRWAQLRRDGMLLIERGRFGRWALPPDWLEVSRADFRVTPAAGWPSRFSFDAIRVPLNLVWSGALTPALHDAFASWWRAAGPTPQAAWVDVQSGERAPYAMPAGMVSVSRLLLAAPRDGVTRDRTNSAIAFPRLGPATDYYGSALTLLSRIAWSEASPRWAPTPAE